MTSQNITFIAVPNGRVGNQLRLSVVLSPRLVTDGQTLALATSFPDFSDFGPVAQSMTFSVQFGSAAAREATPDPDAPTPDAALWRAIFTGVSASDRPMVDLSKRKFRSFPAVNVAGHLQALYGSTANTTKPTQLPTADYLLKKRGLALISQDPDDNQLSRLTSQLEANLAAQGALGNTAPSFTFDMARVGLFFRPPVRATLTKPTINFHELVAALGHHPQLMRRLGLVRDLLIDVDTDVTSATTVSVTATYTHNPDPYTGGGGGGGSSFPGGPGGGGSVGLGTSQRRGPAAYIQSPRTAYVRDTFLTAPRSSDPLLAGRYLRLDDPRFAVLDVDIDGAALKTLQFATSTAMATSARHASADTPTRFALPSLRSDGLALMHQGRDADLRDSVIRQNGLVPSLTSTNSNDAAAATFYAEDLVRGYAVDIWEDAKRRWSPLCMRHVSYRLRDGSTVEIEDEGSVTLTATSDGVGDPEPDMMVPEAIARWTGWSMVVPRPGRHIDDDTQPPVSGADSAKDFDARLKITTTPPRDGRPGLPTLRFGSKYRMRARAVDVAGNAAGFAEDSGFEHATTLQRFQRYEPVVSPSLLPQAPLQPGESVERLVIRSNYDDPPGNASATVRHVVPPDGSQLMAEWTSALDSDQGMDPAFYPILVAKAGQSFDTSALNPTRHPDPSAPASGAKTQFVYPSDYVDIPYLPDPFAHGVSLHGLPFGTTTVKGYTADGGNLQAAWNLSGSTFDTVLSHRLRLAEPRSVTKTSHWSPSSKESSGHRDLTVYLPKGSVATIRISSMLDADPSAGRNPDVVRMAMWWWLLSQAGKPLDADQQRNLRALIALGLHWMFTPYRQVTLVHAVRQPLLAPGWKVEEFKTKGKNPVLTPAGSVSRTRGDTYVEVSGIANVSGRSTSRLNSIATWSDQVDDVRQPGPAVLGRTAHPFFLPIDADSYPIADKSGHPLPVKIDDVRFDSQRHEFGDTKHRTVKYGWEAVSRFAEEFVDSTEVTFGVRGLAEVAEVALVDGYTAIVSSAGDRFVEGRDFVNDPDLVGTVRLVGNAVPRDEQVTVRFLKSPITRVSLEASVRKQGRLVTANVLASARPQPPDVRYVIPAFSWSKWSTNRGSSTAKRSGNTLRVWLGRPWFSSGNDEKLAVLCWVRGKSQPDAEDPAQRFVTLIGQDPVWGTGEWTNAAAGQGTKPSPTTRLLLGPEHFPSAYRTVDAGLLVPGLSTAVGAAIHEVSYDEDRRLWFADIEVDPGTKHPYTPFVRLALARFQANALTKLSGKSPWDLRVSDVVVADIAQLLPGRTVVMKPSSNKVEITVTGDSYASTGQLGPNKSKGLDKTSQAGPSRILAQVQIAREGMSTADYPDTAWENVGTPVSLKGTLADQKLLTATPHQGSWTGSVKVPKILSPSTLRPLKSRVVLTEYEQMYNATTQALTSGRVVFVATYQIN